MKGLAILFGFYWIGTILQQLLDIPLPGNVIGLVLFTTALFLKWIKLEWVEESGQFLLKHMTLLFAPIIVGTLVFIPVIIQNGMPVLLSLFISTFVTLWVTGWVTQQGNGKRQSGISKEGQEHESNSMGR